MKVIKENLNNANEINVRDPVITLKIQRIEDGVLCFENLIKKGEQSSLNLKRRKMNEESNLDITSQISVSSEEQSNYKKNDYKEKSFSSLISINSEAESLQRNKIRYNSELNSIPEAGTQEIISLLYENDALNKTNNANISGNDENKINTESDVHDTLEEEKIILSNHIIADKTKEFWFMCKVLIGSEDYESYTWGHKIHKDCLKSLISERVLNLRSKINWRVYKWKGIAAYAKIRAIITSSNDHSLFEFSAFLDNNRNTFWWSHCKLFFYDLKSKDDVCGKCKHTILDIYKLRNLVANYTIMKDPAMKENFMSKFNELIEYIKKLKFRQTASGQTSLEMQNY